MKKVKSVDEYLQQLEGNFAYPILNRVRSIVHQTAPQVEEAIKWGSPAFEYKGNMMSMVAFKDFAAVWFHKGALFNDPKKLLEASSEATKSMRKYLLPSLESLDEEGLKGLILEALEKQDTGEQVKGYNKRSTTFEHSELLTEALKHHPKAKEHFDALTPYKQREFIEHIESAKQQVTKERRLAKAMDLIAQGLGLHDKYRA